VITIIDRTSIEIIDGKSSNWQVLGVPMVSSPEHNMEQWLREKPSGPTIMAGLRVVSLGASCGQSLFVVFPGYPRRCQELTGVLDTHAPRARGSAGLEDHRGTVVRGHLVRVCRRLSDTGMSVRPRWHAAGRLQPQLRPTACIEISLCTDYPADTV
jgi:hypothetical protein